MPTTDILLGFVGVALSVGAWFFKRLDQRLSDLARTLTILHTDLRVLQAKHEGAASLVDAFTAHLIDDKEMHERLIRIEERLKSFANEYDTERRRAIRPDGV